MSYLITGIGGGLGYYVACKLLDSGLDVVGTDIKSSRAVTITNRLEKYAHARQRQFKVCWADITNASDVKAIFEKNDLQGIAHLAFILPPYSEMDPELARRVNIVGTQNLIDGAVSTHKDIPFVFTSSVTVFGLQPINEIVGPHHPTQETSAYTAQKLLCERMLQETNLDWRILRCSVVMNPTFRPSKESARYGLTIDLKTRIEPVHVYDVATAICNALIRKEATRKIFIIAGGEKNRTNYREYIFKMLNGSISGLEPDDVPWASFKGKQYPLSWYDTTESQSILKYQSRSIDDYALDARKAMLWWEKLGIILVGKKLALKKYFG